MSAPAINLEATRLNRGLSIRAAAREIGIHEQSMRRAESGESVLPSIAFKIATFYGLKVTDIWPVKPVPSVSAGQAGEVA